MRGRRCLIHMFVCPDQFLLQFNHHCIANTGNILPLICIRAEDEATLMSQLDVPQIIN